MPVGEPGGGTRKKATRGCPCGYLGDATRICRCSETRIEAYRSRISGPLLDRIDLIVEVPRVMAQDLSAPPGESSATVRARVVAAQARQRARLDLDRAAPVENARLTAPQVRRYAQLTPSAKRVLDVSATAGLFSARAYEKVMKVALTLADLAARDRVDEEHIAESIGLRSVETRR